MAVKKPKKKKSASIIWGRPPLAKTRTASLSSKATRTLIRSHHNLQKIYTQALKDGNDARARELEAEITASGGLPKYQLASTLGQSAERGGDSSRMLVEWLEPIFEEALSKTHWLRLLEVGALSTKNACSRVACLDVRRIDLKSRDAGIEEVDFMDMPVPLDGEKFHIISLSLVLNYVPDPASRGEMLARLPKFLEYPENGSMKSSVFIVLPLACVTNSRYLTEERLSHIMHTLGFQLSKRKMTSKLYYSLWTLGPMTRSNSHFQIKKEELRSGATRNNFAITLGSRDQE
jgi:25S rRNA (adenine2142-N1)-methyltransferase